ncbi:MAG: class I SAM-dependent methyltransferase [Trinickia sp.]|uniref:class I SAM-dependent methyltransferase n=1 Tax=Trinickia sp. TaxID=2571163 RepID=UPI003F7F61E3
MAGIETSSSAGETALLQAYYRAWSARWIDTRCLREVLGRASDVLWIGSYFSLAEPWAHASSWTIADLDSDMLALGRRALPHADAIRADVRQLPFDGTFDAVIALGAVTAYLLDDESVERAAVSLARSLANAGHARVLIDAYDAASIHSTTYFSGEDAWSSESERWTRQATVEPIAGQDDGVFMASLTVSRETAQRKQSAHFRFIQRAFSRERLALSMTKHGLRLLGSESDPAHGRLYQVYAPASSR